MFLKRLANWSLRHAPCRENSGPAPVVLKIETGFPPGFSLCFLREKTTTVFSVFCGGAIFPRPFLAFVRCNTPLLRPAPAAPPPAAGQGILSFPRNSRTNEQVAPAYPKSGTCTFL